MEVVYIADVQKTYAMVIGAVLLLVGLLGFFPNPLVSSTGLFGVNTYQNILHLVGGGLGLWLGSKGSSKAYNMWLGIIAAVVAVLGVHNVVTRAVLGREHVCGANNTMCAELFVPFNALFLCGVCAIEEFCFALHIDIF